MGGQPAITEAPPHANRRTWGAGEQGLQSFPCFLLLLPPQCRWCPGRFFSPCASEPFIGHHSSGAKAKPSCTKWVNRRHSELGARKETLVVSRMKAKAKRRKKISRAQAIVWVRAVERLCPSFLLRAPQRPSEAVHQTRLLSATFVTSRNGVTNMFSTHTLASFALLLLLRPL